MPTFQTKNKINNFGIFNFKLTQTQIELHKVRTDYSILLQESHLTARQPRRITLIHLLLQTPPPIANEGLVSI